MKICLRKKTHKILLLLVSFSFLYSIVWVGLEIFSDELSFFRLPADVSMEEMSNDKTIKIGGLVKNGSVQRDGAEYSFVISDSVVDIHVRYRGIVPPMFAENRGVILIGKFTDKYCFYARNVLIKHDERYRPPITEHKSG